jgi:hypothetical protein
MVTAATSVRTEELDPEKRNSTAHDFEERLKRKVVGQHEAVQAIVDLYRVFSAHLNSAVGQSETCCSWGRRARGKRAWSKRRRRCCSATRGR